MYYLLYCTAVNTNNTKIVGQNCPTNLYIATCVRALFEQPSIY